MIHHPEPSLTETAITALVFLPILSIAAALMLAACAIAAAIGGILRIFSRKGQA